MAALYAWWRGAPWLGCAAANVLGVVALWMWAAGWSCWIWWRRSNPHAIGFVAHVLASLAMLGLPPLPMVLGVLDRLFDFRKLVVEERYRSSWSLPALLGEEE